MSGFLSYLIQDFFKFSKRRIKCGSISFRRIFVTQFLIIYVLSAFAFGEINGIQSTNMPSDVPFGKPSVVLNCSNPPFINSGLTDFDRSATTYQFINLNSEQLSTVKPDLFIGSIDSRSVIQPANSESTNKVNYIVELDVWHFGEIMSMLLFLFGAMLYKLYFEMARCEWSCVKWKMHWKNQHAPCEKIAKISTLHSNPIWLIQGRTFSSRQY